MSENISEQNTSTYKKSFFGDYFRYKLRTLRGYVILFAILNFLTTAGFSAAVYFISKYEALPSILHPSGYGDLGAAILSILLAYAMAFTVIVEVIALCVLPAVNFRFFNRRSHMDTLGGLPLTTRQLFLGDMLGGAAAFGVSFVPCAVIAIIFAAMAQAGPIREILELTDYYSGFPWGSENVLKLFTAVVITELLCYAAVYAISCFVTACCGKIGSSILFSLVMIAAPAIIVHSTAGHIYENAVGYDSMNSYITAFAATAPVGTLIQTFTKLLSEPGIYAVFTPLVFVILLIIALFVFGAYIAAMKRKAERVDREFVFDAGYYIAPVIVTLAVGMIGVKARVIDLTTSSLTIPITLIALASTIALSVCFTRFFKKKGRDIRIIAVLPTIVTLFISLMTVKITDIFIWAVFLPLILIALASCLVLSYLRKHSVKDIGKGADVFAATISAALLIGVIIQGTNGFGISYYLPPAWEIESVELSGGMITNKIRPADGSRSLTVKTESGIETVLSEHKKLIDDLDNYVSGSIEMNTDEVIVLTYHYKNGLTSFRGYYYIGRNTAASERSDNKFVDAISEIPELYDMTAFGILGNPDMPCTSISYKGDELVEGENTGKPYFGKYLTIKPSARDKFIECYLKDLSSSGQLHNNSWFAKIDYEYLDKAGEHKTYSFELYPEYANVIEFLNDPANTETGTEPTIDTIKKYIVSFNSDEGFAIRFTITHPELAREFLSYTERGGEYEITTGHISITAYDSDNHIEGSYMIKEENKQAALKALIKAIRAHQAIGG